MPPEMKFTIKCQEDPSSVPAEEPITYEWKIFTSHYSGRARLVLECVKFQGSERKGVQTLCEIDMNGMKRYSTAAGFFPRSMLDCANRIKPRS